MTSGGFEIVVADFFRRVGSELFACGSATTG